MGFDWFDTKELTAFAETITTEINAVIPAAPENSKGLNAPKAKKKLLSLANRTDIFLKGRRLNFYKKAKFLNAIKWHLRDAGHSEVFIDEVISFFVPLLR